MLSFSVLNLSWGISVKNGKFVVIVLLMNFRLFCCFCVSWGEKFIIGK